MLSSDQTKLPIEPKQASFIITGQQLPTWQFVPLDVPVNVYEPASETIIEVFPASAVNSNPFLNHLMFIKESGVLSVADCPSTLHKLIGTLTQA